MFNYVSLTRKSVFLLDVVIIVHNTSDPMRTDIAQVVLWSANPNAISVEPKQFEARLEVSQSKIDRERRPNNRQQGFGAGQHRQSNDFAPQRGGKQPQVSDTSTSMSSSSSSSSTASPNAAHATQQPTATPAPQSNAAPKSQQEQQKSQFQPHGQMNRGGRGRGRGRGPSDNRGRRGNSRGHER